MKVELFKFANGTLSQTNKEKLWSFCFHRQKFSYVTADNSSSTSEDGTGMGRSRLEVVVSRGDLGAQFTCQASSLALQEPLKVKTNVAVNGELKITIFFFVLKKLCMVTKNSMK